MRPLICLILVPCMVHGSELRSWTDRQDRKIDAEMLGMEGDSVLLGLKDGRKVPYPLDKLSPADAEYAKGAATKAAGRSAADEDAAAGFDAPWPDRIKVGADSEVTVVEEDADAKRFVYESKNYRYTCDVRLANSVVKGFAEMFEATHLFCRSLPLMMDGGDKSAEKHQILLFEKFEDYVKAGGPPSSAGVFLSNRSEVLVPLSSLGVRPVGSGYMLDRSKSSMTLPHELTHQLTPPAYFKNGAQGWFSEGLAEYVAVTPYRSGSFNVRNNCREMVDYVTDYGSKNQGGRGLGDEITLPPLEVFMLQSYGDFLKQGSLNYGAGLLITYYFMQMDGDGDAKRLKDFLVALREGTSGEEALRVLLDGRTFDQLETEIANAWHRKGVDFTFSAMT